MKNLCIKQLYIMEGHIEDIYYIILVFAIFDLEKKELLIPDSGKTVFHNSPYTLF